MPKALVKNEQPSVNIFLIKDTALNLYKNSEFTQHES